MKTICIKAIVYGKVQGVFYRKNTCDKAVTLGLTGWVKNNSDRTVELVACGPEEKIKMLIEWLWQGPLMAKVSDVKWQEIAAENHESFSVR